jgi:outer membrane biosynthesis protein TonB
MRRLTLTALLLAAPVLAQEASEPPATPPPAEAPAAQPPPEPPAGEAAPAPAPQETPSEAPAPARKRRAKERPKPAPKPAAKAVKPAAPPAPAPVASEAPAAAAETTPAPAAPEPVEPGKVSARERVAEEARVFFSLLLSGDVRTLAFRLDFPFQLESRRFSSSEELVSEWVKALRQRRTDLVTLYDIEVLTPDEMEKKHGPPPKRLGALDYRGPGSFVAVANLSGHAAVAVFRVSQGSVKAVAYTD